MDQSLLTAAAGLRARLESLEVLGNNIANANTAGYKADREFYNLFIGFDAQAGATGEITTMPLVEGSAIDFSQAVLAPTGAPLDLALSGPGFFVVQGPEGTLYTRNGSFRRAATGGVETPDGLPVLGDRGPLTLPPGEVKIAEDGSITVAQQPSGRLQVVEFPATRALAKVGHSYFRSADAGPPPAATRTSVRQGQLESANVNPALAAVRLVEVTRQFEMLSRAVTQVATEMNRRAVEELPRTGG